MTLKRAFVWLFPLYLLAVQHAGLAHALSHAVNPASGQEQLAQSDLCTKCASFAKLSAAATSTPYHSPTPPSIVVGATQSPIHVVAAPRLAPRSRSPPELL